VVAPAPGIRRIASPQALGACRPPHHNACADGDVRLSRSGSLVIVLVIVRPTPSPLHPHWIVEDVLTERQTGAAQELHDLVV
jgi:hypothetical protein